MRPELRRADERWELLADADAWAAAGALDHAQLEALRELHPDDRRRTRPAFRLLFFVFTLFAGLALWAFVLAQLRWTLFGRERALAHALVTLALAAAAWITAEAAMRNLRLRRFGVEEGLVALGVVWGVGALFLAAQHLDLGDRSTIAVMAGALALLAGGACWRWGTPASGALAAVGLFAALYALPNARTSWIAAGAAVAWLAGRGGGGSRLGPAHRRRCDEAFVVACLALYAAVHVAGLQGAIFDWPPGAGGSREVAEPWRTLAWAAMAALPAALLAAGLVARRRLLLTLGALGALATAASAVDALDLGPPWWVLSLAGVALVALALAARFRFAAAPGGSWRGFTDRPLLGPGDGPVFPEIAAALVLLTPEPRAPATPRGFGGRGGEFGGGGASGEF